MARPPIADAAADHPLDDRAVRRLRRVLVRWYRRHRRPLPWRRCGPTGRPDAYHVLVSEAMLQQTQVATAVAYFRRFVAALPTVADLAAADEQLVLRLWQGLGYYRRARHLHAAARAIVAEHGGRVPRQVDTLRRLPGVGRYTAGAVASIAHGQAAPILDGNVARVLARLVALAEPIDSSGTVAALWALAGRLLPSTDPGTFNQALMELGALVCVPRSPRCSVCPVCAHCRAARTGQVLVLPWRRPRRPPMAVEHHVVAVERGHDFLFEQRPDKGLWSRMWQLPTAEHLDLPVRGAQVATWLQHHLGLAAPTPRALAAFGHRTTHRAIRFVLWHATVRGGRLRPRAGHWRRLNAVADLPLANPQRRAIQLVQQAVDEPTPAATPGGPGRPCGGGADRPQAASG